MKEASIRQLPQFKFAFKSGLWNGDNPYIMSAQLPELTPSGDISQIKCRELARPALLISQQRIPCH